MEEVDDLEMQLQSSSSQPAENDHARQLMQPTILGFIAGANHRSPPVSRVSSSKSTTEQEENVVVDIQETEENNSHSRMTIRTLVHVFQSILAFKALVASARVHHGSSCATESEQPEVAEATDSLGTSSEHHVTIGDTAINPIVANQLQSSPRKSISTIVHQKNLLALGEFGGLAGAEVALRTDLVNGICDDEALNRSGQPPISLCLAPTQTFCHLVWGELKNRTLLLGLVFTVLKIVFGIKEGKRFVFYNGVVVLIVVVVLVCVTSMITYYKEQRAQKKLQNHQLVEEVHVKRGGETKVICESELVWGDVLLLKKGDEVPCDGLFVGGEGEQLELEYGSESCIINEQNPFLLYGERVINGDARMVATSTNKDTGWSEMMRKGSGDPNMRFKLETQVEELTTAIDDVQMLIYIVLVLKLIFHYKSGKADDDVDGGVLMVNPGFAPTLKIGTTKVLLITIPSVLLFGLTDEEVPLVVQKAFVYWNKKTLSGKGKGIDTHAVAKMAHVTRICTDTFITEDEMEVERCFIGGKFIDRLTTLSPDVIKVLGDGIGALNQKAVPLVRGMHGSKCEKRWEIIEMKGSKWFEEPCGVLMRGNEETEEFVWHFNGPVNEILNMCKHYYDIKGQKAPLDDKLKQEVVQANLDIHHKHKLKTIALACRPTLEQTQDVDDLILIALLGLKNRNTEDTVKQVRALRERGVETVIVSSKKISVLQDIACKCDVLTNGDSESLVITGEVFRNYTDKERLEKVDKIRALGEAFPSDKLLLVETMMEKGEVVAFLGQRTDEVPTLKRANIGITIGTRSSKKARQNCDIDMEGGSFANLISMVDSGKCIRRNIQSFLQIFLNSTVSCTLISIIEIIAFGDASLTTYQLVFLSLAVPTLGGLALLTKASTDEPVSSVPISCEQYVVTAEMMRNTLFQFTYQAMCSVIIQLKGSAVGHPSQDTKTTVSNILILCQFFNLFSARELQKKNFFTGIHKHKWFWVATAIFIVLGVACYIVHYYIGDHGTRFEWKLLAVSVLLGAVSWIVDWFAKFTWGFIKILVNKT